MAVPSLSPSIPLGFLFPFTYKPMSWGPSPELSQNLNINSRFFKHGREEKKSVFLPMSESLRHVFLLLKGKKDSFH